MGRNRRQVGRRTFAVGSAGGNLKKVNRNRRHPVPAPRRRGARARAAEPWLEPLVTWPETGRGFEATRSSPAGTSEREWLLVEKLDRTRYGRWAIGALLAVEGLTLVVSVIPDALH